MSAPITQLVSTVLHSPRVVDLKKLCILEAQACWQVHVDIYVMNDDGGLVDACLMAAVAALASLQVRRPPSRVSPCSRVHVRESKLQVPRTCVRRCRHGRRLAWRQCHLPLMLRVLPPCVRCHPACAATARSLVWSMGTAWRQRRAPPRTCRVTTCCAATPSSCSGLTRGMCSGTADPGAQCLHGATPPVLPWWWHGLRNHLGWRCRCQPLKSTRRQVSSSSGRKAGSP